MTSLQTQQPLKAGFYPFWFWNDVLSADEIRWQIGQMAAQGVLGFFIHSRQGLKQPYLSETFFQMVDVAIEAAEQHGMIVHLYDEYPYPSGVAGGEVVLGNPEFQATSLIQKSYDLTGPDVYLPLPRGKVLDCTLCPVYYDQIDWSQGRDVRDYVGMVLADESYNETGLTQYNRKRYFASNPTPTLAISLPDGNYRLFVSVQTVVDTHKYWGNFVDVLNADAVREFLKLTHERYAQRLGQKFGSTIASIFVDETEPGWSARLPDAFQREYGYDLLPLLPALQDASHPSHLSVSMDLARLKYALFCQTYDGPVSEWCAEHGIRYSGEKPSLRLSQLRYMDIPGCDVGHTKAGAKMDLLDPPIRCNARAAASASYFYGKEGALCEAYHSLGWSATLQDIKFIAEALLLMGITYLVPHGFFYSTHALKKHDAPPTFFFQMPYWNLFGQLSHRIEKISQYLEGSYIDAKILLVEPHSGLPTRAHLEVYRSLMDLLMEQHLEFLHVDTDILQSGTVENGFVQIRDVQAKVVLVPPMRVVEEPLLKWLEAFEHAGGTVIHCDDARTLEQIGDQVTSVVLPQLQISATQGNAAKVQIVARRRGEEQLWFGLNTSGEPVELVLDADMGLREIPLDETLPVLLAPINSAEHKPTYTRRLAPFESFLLESQSLVNTTQIDAAQDAGAHLSIPIRGSMAIKPNSKNLLRMYQWDMTLSGEGEATSETASVPSMPLANQLEKGRFRFRPDIAKFFGAVPDLRLPTLDVTYKTSFDLQYQGNVEFVMEPGTMLGDWQIQVNQNTPFGLTDFVPTENHIRGSLGIDITGQLQSGQNTITISVQTDRLDGGLRNALYLAGDFGVALQPLALVNRPETGEFEAWEANGLPFYAGTVEYETSFEVSALSDSDTVLVEFEIDLPMEDAFEVSVNAGEWKSVLWSPKAIVLPRQELKLGKNALRIKVYTALARAFEGQSFDPITHQYREVG